LESNDPSNSASENPPDEMLPVSDTETIHPNQESKGMEVHHHSHASHGKKNWKSYFWEFLMLFLAVFCGFLAEYQLEHVIEHNKEKQFVQSYIEDLKLDTAAISANLIYQKAKGKQLDSLMHYFEMQNIKGNESDLYYFARLMVRARRFQNSDRTITQLKNSGALRLIRNEAAADSIIVYQKLVEMILGNIADEREERKSVDPLLASIFNPYVFDKMLDSTNLIHRPPGNPLLRSYDASVHQDLAYLIHLIKGSNVILTTRLTKLHVRATNIIAFLEKEYHFS